MFETLQKLLRKILFPKSIESQDVLFTYNTKKWNYLGNSKVFFLSPEMNAVTRSATIFFFCDKELKKRKIILHSLKENRATFTNHSFVVSSKVWEMGEYQLHDLIESPSKFLLEWCDQNSLDMNESMLSVQTRQVKDTIANAMRQSPKITDEQRKYMEALLKQKEAAEKESISKPKFQIIEGFKNDDLQQPQE